MHSSLLVYLKYLYPLLFVGTYFKDTFPLFSVSELSYIPTCLVVLNY